MKVMVWTVIDLFLPACCQNKLIRAVSCPKAIKIQESIMSSNSVDIKKIKKPTVHLSSAAEDQLKLIWPVITQSRIENLEVY